MTALPAALPNPRPTRGFADLVVDVPRLYLQTPYDFKQQPRPLDVPFARSIWHRLYRCPFLSLTKRGHLRSFLRGTHADLTWFGPFRFYWEKVLKGRPLVGVQDLYFAKNWLRVKHASCEVPDTTDPIEHLKAWQQPELLYQLLHLVYKETVTDPVHYISLLRKHASGPLKRMTEYGCGTAPITAGLFEFTRPRRDLTVTITDIQTVAFHFGAWRLRRCANVVPRLLLPENDFQLDLHEPQDAITCITVAEHMNAPLKTFQRFHQMLRPGGILVFDYINTDGRTMDTMHGARERHSVLDFISAHFDIEHGHIDYEATMGTTVARKR